MSKEMPIYLSSNFFFQLIYRSNPFIAEHITDICQHYKLCPLQNETLMKKLSQFIVKHSKLLQGLTFLLQYS